MDIINISAKFSHKGHSYDGVTLHAGVDFSLVDAPCGAARQMCSFSNCEDAPTGIFFDTVSAVEIDEAANPHYLQLKAGE